MDVFKSDIESKLKDYLLDGAKEKKALAQKNASILKANEIKDNTERKIAKKKKKQYESLWYTTLANKIAGYKMDAWKEENLFRKDPEFKSDKEMLKYKLDIVKTNLLKKIGSQYGIFLGNFGRNVLEYFKACRLLDPNFYKDNEVNLLSLLWLTVLTKSEDVFNEQKKTALELSKELAKKNLEEFKLLEQGWNSKFDLEKIQLLIAEIPLKIEDKVLEIKDTLDMLLGKYLDKTINPESPEFDLNVLIERLKSLIDPLLTSIAPLELIAGKIPIIGELTGIMSIMSSSSEGGSLSKEDIKKLVPKKPSLPTKTSDIASGIFDDILAVSMLLPMICINVIFLMIDTIVGLFNQIAGILGIPGIPYPLSIVTDCITAFPTIMKFMWLFPTLMHAAVKGLLMDKLAEAMALSVPKPNIDLLTLESIQPDIEDSDLEKPTKSSKPKSTNKEYAEIITDKLFDVKEVTKNALGVSIGYDRTDLSRILDSYKKIYDGSETTINKYTAFSGTDKNLIPTKETIKRVKGTPDDFKEKLNKVFSEAQNMAEEVKYDKIKNVTLIVGAASLIYADLIAEKEPNPLVIVPDTITP